jgi:uncharacterized peroxidase-related enzyme
MARVSEISEESLPGSLRDLYRKFTREYDDFTNQVRVVAHSPEAFLHLYGLIDAWREKGTLPRRLVEIAVVTASRVNECGYCVGHHGTALIGLGIPAETVDRILDPDPPGLDEKERLVRDYARLIAERAWGIRDEMFTHLKRHFTDQQIVELTIRVGICILFNKLNQALQLDMEPGVEAAARARNIDVGQPPPGETQK